MIYYASYYPYGAARGLRQPLRQNVRRCSAPVQAEDGRSDLRPGQTGPVQQPPVGPLGLHGECQQQVLRADARTREAHRLGGRHLHRAARAGRQSL